MFMLVNLSYNNDRSTFGQTIGSLFLVVVNLASILSRPVRDSNMKVGDVARHIFTNRDIIQMIIES